MSLISGDVNALTKNILCLCFTRRNHILRFIHNTAIVMDVLTHSRAVGMKQVLLGFANL